MKVYRYRCCHCRRTFRHYPQGVSRAHQTERIRKLRLFQYQQYVSLDYHKQEAVSFRVGDNRQIRFEPLPVAKDEPLRLEVESFLDCVESRATPRVDGPQALRALEVALGILDRIKEHGDLVAQSLAAT